MSKRKDFQYRYVDFITVSFGIDEPDITDIEEFKKDLETNIGTDILFHSSLGHLVIDINLEAISEEREIEVFSLNVRHIFELNNFEDLMGTEKGEKVLLLPKESTLMFTSITYSTTRGLLKAKLAGSRFGEYVLPIIAPHKLAPEGPISTVDTGSKVDEED